MRGNRDPIFLIALGDEHDGLAQRVLGLGYRPVRAEDPLGASLLLARLDRPVRGAILPTPDGFQDRPQELARLAQRTGGMSYIVTGKEPEADEIDGLRRDGVRFCLWDGFNDSELRFVINRALYDSTRGEVRDRTRVPTHLVGSVHSGAGKKTVGVYNLSSCGAYLETHRSMLKGGHVRLLLPLPSGDLGLEARVTSTNVPGNLKRDNLPMGMGVEFNTLDAETLATLEHFVAQRARSFEL